MSDKFTFGSTVHPGLVKVLEETNELGVELSKLMMTGGSFDYWGGRDLRQTISEEFADVLAAMAFFGLSSDLDDELVNKRAHAKLELFQAWHAGYTEARLEDFLK